MSDTKQEVKAVTVQNVGKFRSITVTSDRVIKIYRGAIKQEHHRLKNLVILAPGCVVDVTPDLAEWLLKKKDFQKYGVK